jgi:hypothetical protein
MRSTVSAALSLPGVIGLGRRRRNRRDLAANPDADGQPFGYGFVKRAYSSSMMRLGGLVQQLYAFD